MKAFLVAALLLATVTVPARAQQKSTISFTIENDSFLGTDRYYTHGFRLQYMHRPNEVPQWADRLVHAIPPLGMNPERVRIGGALGQELFTPIRIGTDRLMAHDRPYGAWLHGSLILRRGGSMGELAVMDEFELDLGVIGPEALGGETQTWWHDLTDYVEPRGWHHQIDTEPAIQLFLTRSWQAGWRSPGFWGFDIVPHAKIALGNVYIFGQVGTLVRAGYNLPLDFVVSPMESFSTHPSFNPAKWSIYGFFGADGRVVGRNIFLDGNTFGDSHSVEKENLVADFRVGGAIRYHAWETVVSLVHRTREFELQKDDETFVSVTFQFHF